MRGYLLVLCCVAACGHADRASTPEDLVARGWDAHEAAIAAAEGAASCGEAGAAMHRAIVAHQQDLSAAFAAERDADRLAKIVDYLEAHQDRLDELARRTDAVRERCPDDTTVLAAFRELQPP